jgi:hypothetical protein
VHPDVLNPATIFRLRNWIERCDQEHQCLHSRWLPVLPTRILDVGEPESTGNVKLVETNGNRGQYIALSHCWGASNSFLTTQDTLESMHNGFLPDQAPATFRDAIVLTRCLRIRYLWIDSLCIIQRDKEDWNRESSRMGDVYRNAYLMVAAATAADDAEGFFKPRPQIQCSMKIVAPLGQTANVYLRDRWHRIGDSNLPLDSRGWTLQETYLSRRRLEFQGKKITWYCQSTTWDESRRDYLQMMYPFLSVTELFPGKNTSSENPYQSWYNMIGEDFAQRKFSLPTDRLPALSGLATMVAAQKNGRYCAGLWWEDISYSICWHKRRHYSSFEWFRPDCYIAPSWSWASVNGPATFPDIGESYKFPGPKPLNSVAFYDCQIILRGSNPYGEIECAWLELGAPLAPLSKVTDKQAMGKHERNLRGRDQCENFSIVDRVSEELLSAVFDDVKDKPVIHLFALFMMHAKDLVHGSDSQLRLSSDKVQLSGLILRPAVDQERVRDKYKVPKGLGFYQRVGFFYLETRQAEEVLEMAPVTQMVLL